VPVKPVINLIFIGHVDHGKSTLVGRTLLETGVVSDTVMRKLEEETKRIGKEHAKFAWIMDRLRDERESDQTTDISYRSFETQSRSFTIIDAPGHRDFVRNMITGASQADAAVLVVSAAAGQFEAGIKPSNIGAGEIGGQTREHAALALTLGIKQIVVAINKMDAVNYSVQRYQEVKQEISKMLKQLGYASPENFDYVPIAAFAGENVTKRTANLAWYKGPTLIEALDGFHEAEKPVDKPLRIPVQRSFNVPGVGLVPVGRIETGVLKVGDEILVQPSGAEGTVRSIELFHRQLEKALPGDNIGIAVKGLRKEGVWKGCVIGHSVYPPRVTNNFTARILVLEHPTGIGAGYKPVMFCHTDQVECIVDALESKIDPMSGETVAEKPSLIRKGEAGIIRITTSRPVVIERVSDIPRLARFALRDMGTTIAVGMCIDIAPFHASGP
jgi:elongation factor 1-alpha